MSHEKVEIYFRNAPRYFLGQRKGMKHTLGVLKEGELSRCVMFDSWSKNQSKPWSKPHSKIILDI